MSGRFITFEGVEGCGKTTQIGLLQAALESKDLEILATREPGGPPIAEAIREILLDPRHKEMSANTEVLLYCAARAQHVEQIIRPALEAGQIVLCDRFADSTTAYQGAGRGLAPEELKPLHRAATGGIRPDLTLLLDLPAEEGLTRTRGRGRSDRIEREALAFHERVRQGFIELAQREPDRIKVIDGAGTVDEVADCIREHVCAVLEKRALGGKAADATTSGALDT